MNSTVMIIGREGTARAEGAGPLPGWLAQGMRVIVRPLREDQVDLASAVLSTLGKYVGLVQVPIHEIEIAITKRLRAFNALAVDKCIGFETPEEKEVACFHCGTLHEVATDPSPPGSKAPLRATELYENWENGNRNKVIEALSGMPGLEASCVTAFMMVLLMNKDDINFEAELFIGTLQERLE